MAQVLLDARDGQRFEVAARLAQSDAAQQDVAYGELAADEVIERHAAG
jgi:hypothetical protein